MTCPGRCAETGSPAAAAGDLATRCTRPVEAARPGDVVLLSPACASYDQYRDFEARGEHFRALVLGGGPDGRGGEGPRLGRLERARRRQARPEREPRRKRVPPPLEHRILMTATLCLLAFGAVMVYSASSPIGVLNGGGTGTGAVPALPDLRRHRPGGDARAGAARVWRCSIRGSSTCCCWRHSRCWCWCWCPGSASRSTARAAGSRPGRSSSSPPS